MIRSWPRCRPKVAATSGSSEPEPFQSNSSQDGNAERRADDRSLSRNQITCIAGQTSLTRGIFGAAVRGVVFERAIHLSLSLQRDREIPIFRTIGGQHHQATIDQAGRSAEGAMAAVSRGQTVADGVNIRIASREPNGINRIQQAQAELPRVQRPIGCASSRESQRRFVYQYLAKYPGSRRLSERDSWHARHADCR